MSSENTTGDYKPENLPVLYERLKSSEIPPKQPEGTPSGDVGELTPEEWNDRQDKRHVETQVNADRRQKEAQKEADRRDRRHVILTRWLIFLAFIQVFGLISVFYTPNEVRQYIYNFFCNCTENSSKNNEQTVMIRPDTDQLRIFQWQKAYQDGYRDGVHKSGLYRTIPDLGSRYFLIPYRY